VSPATPSQRLVILLHGLGGTGSIMMPIATPWRSQMPSTRFAAPDAPFASPHGGRQWFGVDGQELRPDHIAMVRAAFDKLIADIIDQEGFSNALGQVAFLGVSQGAIMALDAVASGRWKIGALVSFAGLLPIPPVPARTRMPVLLIHGKDDQTIPAMASGAAAVQLKAAGYDVTLDIQAGIGHTISIEGAQEALVFLKKRFLA
jgi:phospholipase/carboxylesterase